MGQPIIQTNSTPNAAMRPVGKAIIEATHISKTFSSPGGGTLSVLSDITLALHDGEVLALLGRSGSGKSTLLRILAGLIPTSNGQVTYNGTPIQGPIKT